VGSTRSVTAIALLVTALELASSTYVTGSAQPSVEPTALVRVDNIAGVRAEDLGFAQGRAASVFSKIGVRLVWTDEDGSVQNGIHAPFTLVLSDATITRPPSSLVDALGFAEPTVGRAGIFCDRIAELTARSAQSAPTLLGDVMAHELGHLLLPAPGHSLSGIMRAGVSTKLLPADTFTRAQAREILSRLRREQNRTAR
jgi:hypothetical protein